MLRKTILKFKIAQNLKGRAMQTHTDFKSSKKIALIYSDLMDQEENMKTVIEELEKDGKNVNKMVFCHDPTRITTPLPHFTSKDISVGGEIGSDELLEFIRYEYDFAICLDESRHYLIDYVFSLVKAKCRVGFMHPDRNKFFEMMVQAKKEEKQTGIEVIKYLKMIQSV